MELRVQFKGATVDSDEHYCHGQWSIDDRCKILIIYSSVEYIKYPIVDQKKNLSQNPTATKLLKHTFLLCRIGLTQSLCVLEKLWRNIERGLYQATEDLKWSHVFGLDRWQMF